ncbi:hypothetical protein MP638_004963 [Amoeboaphelidium occidentale]|nr:hypothetical protein MP638_004963 [Amoeboaphelidium occidentale]
MVESVEEAYDFSQIEVTNKSDSTRKRKRTEVSSKDGAKQDVVSLPSVKTQYGIWIGNLAFKTTAESLMKFFESCGEISRVSMPTSNGKNKGFAHIDFKTEEDKQKAIALSEQECDGRKVLIKDANDYEVNGRKDRGAKKPKKQNEKKAEESNRLFIGNIALTSSRDGIRQTFEKFGKVAHLRVSEFEDSGKCKGYAWVEYETIDEAKAAVVCDKIKLDGRILRVEYAKGRK